MQNADVFTLRHAMVLAIPWSLLLAASFVFVVLGGNRKEPRGSPALGRGIALVFVGIVFLEPGTHLVRSIAFWELKTGQSMDKGQAGLMVMTGLLCVWFVSRKTEAGIWRKAPFLIAGLFLIQQAVACTIHRLHWWRSDMLGMIALGVDALSKGHNPYAEPIRELPLLYLPGLVALHAPGFLGGLDLRFVPVVLGAIALALLGRLGSAISPALVVGMAGLFLGPYMFAREDVHVPVLWLVLGLSLWAMNSGRDRWAGFFWGWAMASREWFWVLTPFWILVLWRTRSPAQRKMSLGFAVGTAGLFLVPAYAHDPMSLFRSFAFHGPALASRDPADLLVSTVDFGFAWIPVLLNIRTLFWLMPLACFALGLGLAWKKLRNLRDFAAWGALTLAAVQFWNPLVEPYHFLLPAYLLLASEALEKHGPQIPQISTD